MIFSAVTRAPHLLPTKFVSPAVDGQRRRWLPQLPRAGGCPGHDLLCRHDTAAEAALHAAPASPAECCRHRVPSAR